MAELRMLRGAEVRALLRFVGECRDLGDDRTAWRWHFLARLAGIVGTDAGLKGEMAGGLSLKAINLGAVFWLPSGITPPPDWGEPLACEGFVADRDWYGSPPPEDPGVAGLRSDPLVRPADRRRRGR